MLEGKDQHSFNTRIKRLLQTNAKSIESLAKHLSYDLQTVEQRLNGKDTFEFPDLVKICAFLNLLPADFFYDRVADATLHFTYDCNTTANKSSRIAQTHEQLLNYYFTKVVYN